MSLSTVPRATTSKGWPASVARPLASTVTVTGVALTVRPAGTATRRVVDVAEIGVPAVTAPNLTTLSAAVAEKFVPVRVRIVPIEPRAWLIALRVGEAGAVADDPPPDEAVTVAVMPLRSAAVAIMVMPVRVLVSARRPWPSRLLASTVPTRSSFARAALRASSRGAALPWVSAWRAIAASWPATSWVASRITLAARTRLVTWAASSAPRRAGSRVSTRRLAVAGEPARAA
ncbi:hypothetical protein D3C72_759420 [compost metagenome]